LVKRFCGLLRLPRERSVARWLKRFTHKSQLLLRYFDLQWQTDTKRYGMFPRCQCFEIQIAAGAATVKTVAPEYRTR
jgi:hypothetical protein